MRTRSISPNPIMSSIPSSTQTAEVCASLRKMMVSFSQPIFKLCLFLEGYFLDHAIGTETQEEESVDRLWLVARSLKNENGKYDYKIEKFDAIKLGRVRFRVKDFRCDNIHMSEKELYHQELREAMEVKGTKDVDDASQDQI